MALKTSHEAHILVFGVSNAKYLALDTPDENTLQTRLRPTTHEQWMRAQQAQQKYIVVGLVGPSSIVPWLWVEAQSLQVHSHVPSYSSEMHCTVLGINF